LFDLFENLPLNTLGLLPNYPYDIRSEIIPLLTTILDKPFPLAKHLRHLVRVYDPEAYEKAVELADFCKGRGIKVDYVDDAEDEYDFVRESAHSNGIRWTPSAEFMQSINGDRRSGSEEAPEDDVGDNLEDGAE